MPRGRADLRTVGGRRIAALLTVLALTSCGLPTRDGVHVVRRIATDRSGDDSDIRRIAPGPAPGATPEAIVRGFFGAEANDDDLHAVARQFLADPASWNADSGVDVYDEAPLQISLVTTSDPRRMTASVAFDRTGRIGRDGAYVQDVGRVTETLELRRDANEWRLSKVPGGLQLSSRDVTRSYLSATVWFLSHDESRPRLVPDLRLLPTTQAGLPSSLMRALLGGPSDRIASAVRTAVPSGTQLSGSAVLVDGEVSVDLTAAAATVRGDQRDLMLAQLAQTLGQVTGAQRLRITSGGRGLAGADPEVGSIEALTGILDPTGDEAPSVTPTAYGIVKGSVQALNGGEKPPGWTRVSNLLRIVGDPEAQRLAALQRQGEGTTVLVGGVSQRAQQVLPASSWDSVALTPDGKALAHRAAGGSALVLADSLSAQQVAGWSGLGSSSIAAMAMARDGVHVALAIRRGGTAVLQLAALVTGATPRLIPLGPAIAGLSDVVDLAWSSATEVLVIASSDATTAHPFEVLMDGSSQSPLPSAGLPSQPETITGWPGSRTMVVDDGRAWTLGSGWTPIGAASDVAYA